MSKILSYIGEYMEGNAWEGLCVQCYHSRYLNDHYRPVPAMQGGDAGIEGFTQNGITHQCYCPEREYTDDKLYDHQRDKLTEDMKKLINNAKRLQGMGVPLIREWHFVIPEYKDSRILVHAESKRQEVLKAKKENPLAYAHIADDFQIIIKTAESFKPEISRIVRTTLTNMRLNLAVLHADNPDWSKCDSQKAANIRRKIKAVMHLDDDSNDDLVAVIDIYGEYYLSGIEVMNNLRIAFPEIHEEVYRLEQSYKREVFARTRMNTNRTMNQALFDDILNQFQAKLEKDFSHMFTIGSIGELKQDMIAGWLADCSMEFRSA